MTSPFIFGSLNRDMENQIHEIKSVERANELIAHLEDNGIPRYIVEEFGYDAMVVTTNPENPTKRQFLSSVVLGILRNNGYIIGSVGIYQDRPIVYLE